MSPVTDPAASPPRFVSAKVFVRGLTVDAEIGVHAHERGRRQPLIVDVELDVAAGGWRSIGDTVNYERIVRHARDLADGGHILLVETFALRLARACLSEPSALRARVRVEKPHALAPQAQAAGVEIVLERD
jgi:7,8-dihydroneopterin aldolase/epimerase/oxygenase